LSALLALFCLPVNAQFSAAVQGSVLDPSQAAVPSAKVTITSASTGITVETQSTTAGFYRFSSLAPGAYTLKVVAPGFRTPTIAVALTTGQTRDLNINLEVQSAGETVSVTGEASILDTAESRQQVTME
jgi:uncharacterized membrane protein